jgi:hypothetical protein
MTRIREDLADMWASQTLADAVVERLMGCGTPLPGLETLYVPGCCRSPASDASLSVLIDGESGSIGFVEDCRGALWLTTRSRGDSAGRARRIGTEDDVTGLVRACTEALSGIQPDM